MPVVGVPGRSCYNQTIGPIVAIGSRGEERPRKNFSGSWGNTPDRPDRRKRMKVKIGELAKMTGCQVVTIRYYEKEGLLKRPERTERNYRLYGDEDIARLRFIRHCRQHGMSLDEIRTLLVYSDHPTGSCDWINALIHKHIEAVEQQIRDLEHLKAHLESLYHKCDGSREGGCGILKSLIDGENCQYCQARQQRTGQEHP